MRLGYIGVLTLLSALNLSVHSRASASTEALPDTSVSTPVFVAPDSVSGTAIGQVLSETSPVPFAQVSIKGNPRVFEANAEGRFVLEHLRPGAHVILVTAMGYETLERTVLVRPGQTTTVSLEILPSAIALNPIVVTGTMRETFVSESPVKVDVVNVRFLQRNTTNNLMESIQNVNGLETQIDCAVCYTNNIRINGMEGPYTAILIDGMPIMSSLATVYGLNGINPAMIEQVEIIKGPSSTLYGSEAMGGVVNLITKDLRFAPRYALDLRAQSTGERILDFALSPGSSSLRTSISGSVQLMDEFLDENGDNFSDIPKNNTATFFGKLAYEPGDRPVFGLAAKYYYEDRWGGVSEWRPSDRGSDAVYGESIYTNRVELIGNLTPSFMGDWRLDFSYAWHDQDAVYGDTPYVGEFHTYFGNLTRAGIWREDHNYLVGLTARHLVHDDNTVATAQSYNRFIPGVFFQDEYTPTAQWSLLGGMRLDHHENHGIIASPRASLKFSPEGLDDTTFRINAGTGFRVVNAFSEDFAGIVHGSRDVIVGEDLDPEKSWSVTGNINQILDLGGNPMMVDLDLFYTRFDNQLVADYDADPYLIVFRNLDGMSVTRGVSLSFNQNFSNLPLLYSFGMTFQDVYTEENGFKEKMEFSPDFTGTWSVAYTSPIGLTLDYTGNVMGPKRMPEYDPPFQRDPESETYAIHNLQGTLNLGGGREVYASVKNIFDWTQGSPLVDPANPFGDSFDTAYIYGPIYGRYFQAGLRLTGGR